MSLEARSTWLKITCVWRSRSADQSCVANGSARTMASSSHAIHRSLARLRVPASRTSNVMAANAPMPTRIIVAAGSSVSTIASNPSTPIAVS